MPSPSKKAAKKKNPGAARSKRASTESQGFKKFAMHQLDRSATSMFAELKPPRGARASFAASAVLGEKNLDPETAAQQYLARALGSEKVPAITVPKSKQDEHEFKTISTETIPLTGTKTVKFRQTINKIPVYGSLVTVEMDDANSLLGINSAIGQPSGVSSVAEVSPADAVQAIKKIAEYKTDVKGIVPRLNFYFDGNIAKWRLVFILEDVPIVPAGTKKKREGKLSPFFMDFVVDAHSGKIVAKLPRTPTMAVSTITAVDGLGAKRKIRVEDSGAKNLLRDTTYNVQTYDFEFKDPETKFKQLPGKEIKNPPSFSPTAVSAHANAVQVAEFLRGVLKRNNIDDKGGAMNSSINCVVKAESPGNNVWFNAFWDGVQMVYGQVLKDDGSFYSFCFPADVVGHEMFHGVTDMTSRLEYANQSGALNESYSDIFGAIIANFGRPIANWNWKIGEGLEDDGAPLRDMSNPKKYGQPAHMKDYVKLPNTDNGDYGGVHYNSGIHNKAAYKILTAADGGSAYAFAPKDVAAIFYLALTQHLSRNSQFSDSRRAVLMSARTYFRALSPAKLEEKIKVIEKGFSSVGIK